MSLIASTNVVGFISDEVRMISFPTYSAVSWQQRSNYEIIIAVFIWENKINSDDYLNFRFNLYFYSNIIMRKHTLLRGIGCQLSQHILE